MAVNFNHCFLHVTERHELVEHCKVREPLVSGFIQQVDAIRIIVGDHLLQPSALNAMHQTRQLYKSQRAWLIRTEVDDVLVTVRNQNLQQEQGLT